MVNYIEQKVYFTYSTLKKKEKFLRYYDKKRTFKILNNSTKPDCFIFYLKVRRNVSNEFFFSFSFLNDVRRIHDRKLNK